MSDARAGFARSAAGRLGAVVKPLGFVRDGNSWTRDLPGGGQKLNVQLLKSLQEDRAAIRVNVWVWFYEVLEPDSPTMDRPRLVYQWMLPAGGRSESRGVVGIA